MAIDGWKDAYKNLEQAAGHLLWFSDLPWNHQEKRFHVPKKPDHIIAIGEIVADVLLDRPVRETLIWLEFNLSRNRADRLKRRADWLIGLLDKFDRIRGQELVDGEGPVQACREELYLASTYIWELSALLERRFGGNAGQKNGQPKLPKNREARRVIAKMAIAKKRGEEPSAIDISREVADESKPETLARAARRHFAGK